MSAKQPTGFRPPRGGSVPLGVWLLARGRSIGVMCFEPGVPPLMAALAPTVAVAIIAVGLTFQAPSAEWGMGLVRAFVPLTCTLLQLVVSHTYARWVHREGLWTRYATASLWCAWVPLIMASLAVGVWKGLLPHAGAQSILLISLAVQIYGLWLTWYTSKIGLLISNFQAVCITALQVVAVVLLLVVLSVLPPHYNAMADMLIAN
nr:hypothetical protein [uncultured Neokomagataea sp.]